MNLNEKDFKLIIKSLELLTKETDSQKNKQYIVELRDYFSSALCDMLPLETTKEDCPDYNRLTVEESNK